MSKKPATSKEEKAGGKTFAKAIISTDFFDPRYRKLVDQFCAEMHKALTGRICTPERMALLYPIFREINVEMDEINAFWAKERKKMEKKESKK